MAVSLQKGQRISLSKAGAPALTQVMMGLGWDAAKSKGFWGRLSTPTSIDLDASCVFFNASLQPTDEVWFRHLTSRCGSVQHRGDNLTGDGDGDDEQILVDLNRIPQDVHHLVFTVNSFRGQTFNEVDNAKCRLVDARQQTEIARYTLSGGGEHTAMVMARLYRGDDGWKMHALGEKVGGRTVKDMIPHIIPLLA